MTRTLHLHIGAHRTATTSIQAFLRANFVPLQRKGYFVPYAAGRHFDLVNRLFDGRTTVAEAAADIDARADSKKFPLSDIVVSDEDICMRRDLSVLTRFQDHYEVRVVFAMRRQDLWLESWHQQNVKWQWNPDLAHLTFPEFLERQEEFFWIDYDRTLTHLEELFGAENLRPIVFEKGQMPQGPVETFCDAIGLTDREGLEPAPQANTSLLPVMSEFMRTLPLDEIPGPQRKLFERACALADTEMRRDGADTGMRLMDRPCREELLAGYEKGNAAVAKRYFGRDVLFREALPDGPSAPQRLPENSYEAIETFVAPFVRSLGLLLQKEAEERKAGARPEEKKAKSPTAAGRGA